MNTDTPVTDRLPVIVITGFLGSGKTTLLNSLLQAWPLSAVLINEFGTVPIDPQLIRHSNLPVMTLSGGCLCCQVRGALTPMLKNIRMGWKKPGTSAFDRLFIETSGIANPEPVLDTLLRDRWLFRHCRLDAVITVVAATTGASLLDRFAEAKAQVAWADRIVVTQSDLATESQADQLDEYLNQIVPGTPRLSAVNGDIDTETLMRTMNRNSLTPGPEAKLPSTHSFQSISLYLSKPLPSAMLRAGLEQLLARHTSLTRIKGIVELEGQTGPVAVHAAEGRLYPMVALPPREIAGPCGRLVFITHGPTTALEADFQALFNRYGRT